MMKSYQGYRTAKNRPVVHYLNLSFITNMHLPNPALGLEGEMRLNESCKDRF